MNLSNIERSMRTRNGTVQTGPKKMPGVTDVAGNRNVRFRIDGVDIFLREGDLCECPVDAVVHMSDIMLDLSYSPTLRDQGGPVVESEINKNVPNPLGGAVATRAGDLPCRYLLHASVVDRGLDLAGASLRRMHATTTGLLKLARNLRVRSLALPAIIGAGKNRTAFIDGMLDSLIWHLGTHSYLRKIYFISKDDNFEELYHQFREKLD